jgi:hypothetical protein
MSAFPNGFLAGWPVRRTLPAVAAVLTILGLWIACPAACAVSVGSGWTVTSVAEPTNFSSADTYSSEAHEGCIETGETEPPQRGGLCDRYALLVTNTSGQALSGPIRIAAQLPSSELEVANVEARNLEAGEDEQVEGHGFQCSTAAVACTYNGTMPSGDILQVTVRVFVKEGAPSETVEDHATVEKEGIVVAASGQPTTMPNTIDGDAPGFGFQDFSFQAYDRQGALDELAGDHPSQVTATFDLDSRLRPEADSEEPFEPPEEVKDVVIELPLGFTSDPLAAPRCSESILVGDGSAVSGCPATSRIGNITINLGGDRSSSILTREGRAESPLYNMVPDGGYPAEFGADVANKAVLLYGQVAPTASGYRLRVLAPGTLRPGGSATLDGISLTFFGDLGEQDAGVPEAFFANPTACSAEPVTAAIYADSWTKPGEWAQNGELLRGSDGPASTPLLSSSGWVRTESVSYPAITECDQLQFNPAITATPSTTQADEPVGYTLDLRVPQAPNIAPDRATPALRSATVTLPAGLSISPAAAEGLEGCTEAQFAPTSSEPGSCSAKSQVGTATLTTPLLASPLRGEVFLRAPECAGGGCEQAAAEGRMFGLFVQAQESGVTIKLEGRLEAGTGGAESLLSGLAPGQLRASFEEDPQLPFSELSLQFAGGAHALLANPQGCEQATTAAELTAWSSEAPQTAFASFDVDWDGDGGACPVPPPFSPSFDAGLANASAGASSSLSLTFSRGDREQDLSTVTVDTPPGLFGMLSRVTPCAEPQASVGNCPPTSEIGAATVALGAGAQPFWLPQPSQPPEPVYLTGPYDGAPFGLAIVVHADAGPFDFGDVIIRAAINVDPRTAALSITSGPLPQLVDGVPLRIRAVNVTLDRAGFMFAPTNCSGQAIAATITSAQGATAGVSSPFDVGGCRSLPFRPTFTAASQGRAGFDGDGASLTVRIGTDEGPGANPAQEREANLEKLDIALPPALPARLTTLQKACTEAQFGSDPAGCPSASDVGSAVVHTPVLADALAGPVYLVSRGKAALPELVLVLQGDGVTIDLIGDTQIKKGITYSRFEALPDVPFDNFELELPEGPHSALAANRNLCASKRVVTVRERVSEKSQGRVVHVLEKVREALAEPLAMPTTITAENGAVLHQTTEVTITGCPARKPAKNDRAKKSRRVPQR